MFCSVILIVYLRQVLYNVIRIPIALRSVIPALVVKLYGCFE
jgi:hypothetical protein